MLKLKNKLISAFLIAALALTASQPVLFAENSDEEEPVELTEEEKALEREAREAEAVVISDVPIRTEAEMLELAEVYAENEYLKLYVIDKYMYYVNDEKNVRINLDENGGFIFESEEDVIKLFGENTVSLVKAQVALVEDGAENSEGASENGENASDNDENSEEALVSQFFEVEVRTLDDNVKTIKIPIGEVVYAGAFAETDGEIGFIKTENDSERAASLTFNVIYQKEKEKADIMFGVQNKANGFVWWSSPINATRDPVAKGAQIDALSSLFTYTAGNPSSFTSAVTRSSAREKRGIEEYYISYCNKIEKITKNGEDIGARFSFNFRRGVFTLVLEITLDGDSILATIPADQVNETNIKGQSGSVALSMAVLNSFGAAHESEDGYIVVPDGSGAVINFNNQKTNAALYNGQVYGRDAAVSQKVAAPVTEQVYFPVFGIVRKSGQGDNALVAIAEKGDENAFIRANVSRQNATSYNSAWFEFRTRTTDSYYIGTRNNELVIYEQGYIKTGDIAIRYYPLAGSELSYVDVANTYRDYLIKNDGIKQVAKANSAPYYVTLDGGTVKTHSIAGIPVDLQTSGTSYSEAAEIAGAMKTAGVTDLRMIYNDFTSSGIKREISPTVKYSSMLGGKKEYAKLNEFINQSGYSLAPSFGIMEYFKSGNGYSYLLNSSKQTTRSYASQEQYEYAFGTVDKTLDAWTILSPYYYSDVFERLTTSLREEGITRISLDNATYFLYSDFSRKNPYGGEYFNRRDTEQILAEGFKKLNDAGISITAQSANAYALPYVDEITQVPLFSSNYDIFDYDIPFYQIVIHGLVPYTTKAFNASADSDTLRLLALSTGTPLHYEFMYEKPSEFQDSDYNSKFYADYQGWSDKALKEYALFKDVISDVSDKKIVDHKRLSVYETETTFEGGKTIYINLDTGELKVNGEAISFGDYGLNRRASYVG